MKWKRVAFWMAMLALGVSGMAGLLAHLPADAPLPALALGDERTIILEVVAGGDVHIVEEASCDVWGGGFNCELRRGGDLGVVASQYITLTAPLASADPPPDGTVVVSATLTWDTSALAVGPYETFCRLELSNGIDEIWGYIEGQGQDGQGFYLADKFAVGQTCIVPRRFIATLQ